jgi:hypothetical protein
LYKNKKLIPVETVPGMGEGGIKDNGRNSEFKYGIFVVL